MKVQTRKIVEKTEYVTNENTGKTYKYINRYENGYVETVEFDPQDVNAFSMNKATRLIGIDKNLYYLTLKSWKETKKELSRLGILQKLDLSKAS